MWTILQGICNAVGFLKRFTDFCYLEFLQLVLSKFHIIDQWLHELTSAIALLFLQALMPNDKIIILSPWSILGSTFTVACLFSPPLIFSNFIWYFTPFSHGIRENTPFLIIKYPTPSPKHFSLLQENDTLQLMNFSKISVQPSSHPAHTNNLWVVFSLSLFFLQCFLFG